MKRCRTCQLNRELTNFRMGANDKLKAQCKLCAKAVRQNRSVDSRIKDRERHAKYIREHLEKNREYQKRDYEKHHQQRRAKQNERYGKYRTSNNARAAKRRAAKAAASFNHLLNEIKDIYKNCPIGHHVDHIVPLQGRDVCGLHVPWNLQYLLAEDNLKKGNKVGTT